MIINIALVVIFKLSGGQHSRNMALFTGCV